MCVLKTYTLRSVLEQFCTVWNSIVEYLLDSFRKSPRTEWEVFLTCTKLRDYVCSIDYQTRGQMVLMSTTFIQTRLTFGLTGISVRPVVRLSLVDFLRLVKWSFVALIKAKLRIIRSDRWYDLVNEKGPVPRLALSTKINPNYKTIYAMKYLIVRLCST